MVQITFECENTMEPERLKTLLHAILIIKGVSLPVDVEVEFDNETKVINIE